MEKRRTYYPLYWIGLSALVLLADYATGPLIQFPIVYVVPIILASWYSGRTWGVGLAALLPCIRPIFYHAWGAPLFSVDAAINTVIRLTVLVGLAFLVSYAASLTREIKVLKGLLPVCSNCKKIRDENGSWKRMETYISEHSDAEFTHGLCDECAEKLYPRYYQKQRE